MPNTPPNRRNVPNVPNNIPGTEFSAPWSRQLKLVTLLTSVVLFGTSATLLVMAPEHPPRMYWVAIWSCPIIFLLCALFSVRGYRLQAGKLIVLRPGWSNRVSLREATSVACDPEAMEGAIRIFGNGGFFAFTGLFRNQRLGRYRAFATDASRSVVIRLPASTVVVTPDQPEKFVELLKSTTNMPEAS